MRHGPGTSRSHRPRRRKPRGAAGAGGHSLAVDLPPQDIELDGGAPRLGPAGDRLEIAVRAIGIGMDPRRIEAMFGVFTLTAAGPDPAPGGPTAAKAKRDVVLIADDNVDAGWGMAKLLEMAGFETLRAATGADALQAMARHRPDAAVIDIGMPDVDGHEVARRVRAADWGRCMVLVAATGWSQQSDAREAARAGFDAHLTKPVDARQLAGLLQELLASKRG